MKLQILADLASLFYATPNLRSLEKHKRSHPQFENPHRKKARHICQWVAIDAGYKQSDVARFWGMNHATVIYGCKAVNDRIDTDPAEKEELEEFMAFAKKRINGANGSNFSGGRTVNNNPAVRKAAILGVRD